MTSVNPSQKTHTFDGDGAAVDLVDAAQLDTQLSRSFQQGNQIIAALNRITDATDNLAAKTVGLRQLKAEVVTALEGLPVPLEGVATVATTNVSLSGLQTLNGHTLTATERVLLVGQTDKTENGLWIAAAGAWARPSDFPAGAAVDGLTNVSVTSGNLQGAGYLLQTDATVDTTDQTWVIFQAAYPIGLANGGHVILLGRYASLSDAVTDIGSEPVTLVLDVPSTLTGDLVIPATIALLPTPNGVIDCNGHTLTVNGAVMDVAVQAFNVNGGSVVGISHPINAELFDSLKTAIASGAPKITVSKDMTVSETITIANPTTLSINSTITGDTGIGSSLFVIASSNVTITGTGTLDGNGLQTGAIYTASTARWENINVSGLTFIDWYSGEDTSSGAVVGLDLVDGGSIDGCTAKDCGTHCFYLSWCRGVSISNCRVFTTDFCGVLIACGVGCSMRDCYVEKAGYFCFKGGYGTTGATVLAGATTTYIDITASAALRNKLRPGQTIYSLTNSNVLSANIISITDNTTTLRITTEGFGGTPTTGAEVIIADTGCNVINCTAVGSGENAFDFNVVNGLNFRGCYSLRGGRYTDIVGGGYSGVSGGIWVGADPISGVNDVHCKDISITGCIVEETHGEGIMVWSSIGRITIANNVVRDFSLRESGTSPADPAYGGISANRLTFVASGPVTVSGNVIKSVNGWGIRSGYCGGIAIVGNSIDCPAGVSCVDTTASTITGNSIGASRSGADVLRIEKASQSIASAFIDANSLSHGSNSGNVINVIDATSTGIFIGKSNFIQTPFGATPLAGTAALITQESPLPMLGKPSRLGRAYEGKTEYIQLSVAAGATAEIGQFIADNGTSGGAIINGAAWGPGRESFEVWVYGDRGVNGLAFASKVGASTFLASGDFTLTNPSGSIVQINYTNNEASTVHLMLSVTLLSRAG